MTTSLEIHRSCCDRHPDHPFTGFCASCLRERLDGLETSQQSQQQQQQQRKPSAAALKSIFFKSSSSTSDLRRCQSFSASRATITTSSAAIEPQRRSCDVRGRITAAAAGTDGVALKSMKDHIDLVAHRPPPPTKEPTAAAGSSFWLAASAFSKKLQKWRPKQKHKKHTAPTTNDASTSIHPDNSRKAQSEMAVDAFGRRSCDIAPRFSLDAGRTSVDVPRLSWDAPRASWDAPRSSWDGHMITGSGRSMLASSARQPPMMLAVGEDADSPYSSSVERWDCRIPVEEDATIPGGYPQTRDYYLDSSSSRRRSLDRSNSVRKQSFEFSELKPVSNAKVSPAFFHAHNGTKLDRDSRDYRCESFESALRDHPQKEESKKKSKLWSNARNIWGFIHRRGSSKGGGAGNEAERRFSESLPEQAYNGNIFQSNTSINSRSSIYNDAGFGSMRRSNVESSGHGRRRSGEFVLERNRSRSARYPPSHVDNGLTRFHFTPMQGSRRSGLPAKNRHSTSYSVTGAATYQ